MVLNEINGKIVNAVIAKCEREYPGTLAMISVHGSVLTGDTHKGSDLDLNIVVNDGECGGISSCFLLEDSGIGYDLYCTSWDDLDALAECRTPHLSRLLDGEVLYAKDREAEQRFLSIRKKTRERLAAPFSKEDLDTAETHFSNMKDGYFRAMTAETLSDVRRGLFCVIDAAVRTVMTANKTYFKRGVKRTFEELRPLVLPENFEAAIRSMVRELDAERLKQALTAFVGTVDRFLDRYRDTIAVPKPVPTKELLAGTYEEMISNWHKKVREAAEHDDVYSAFMAVSSADYMRNEEIAAVFAMETQDILSCFDPADLPGTFLRFEQSLDAYRQEYEKVGLPVNRYRDVDDFVRHYAGSGI